MALMGNGVPPQSAGLHRLAPKQGGAHPPRTRVLWRELDVGAAQGAQVLDGGDRVVDDLAGVVWGSGAVGRGRGDEGGGRQGGGSSQIELRRRWSCAADGAALPEPQTSAGCCSRQLAAPAPQRPTAATLSRQAAPCRWPNHSVFSRRAAPTCSGVMRSLYFMWISAGRQAGRQAAVGGQHRIALFKSDATRWDQILCFAQPVLCSLHLMRTSSAGRQAGSNVEGQQGWGDQASRGATRASRLHSKPSFAARCVKDQASAEASAAAAASITRAAPLQRPTPPLPAGAPPPSPTHRWWR